MDYRYYRLNPADRTIRRSYSSINTTTSSTTDEEQLNNSWFKKQCNRFLYSDGLVLYHEKQRAYKARHSPGVVQTFLASIVLFIIVLFGSRALMASNMFQSDSVVLFSSSSQADIIDLIKDIPSSISLRGLFLHYASHTRRAGSSDDEALTNWTQDKFIQFGLTNTSIETYYPYINYPIQRSLAIVSGPEELLYQAKLNETGNIDEAPTFHAYSASGNVTGSIVYVNYGRIEDFVLLVKNNINMEGTIALIRYDHQIPSGIQVQNAGAFGCIGALIYTDPALNIPTSLVHRETVQRSFIHPGDPYTFESPAVFNATRNDTAYNLQSIPSLPISWDDALPLLRATQDHGFVEPSWIGERRDQIGYFTGPSVAQCNLVNFNDFRMRPISNVLAHITGQEEPEKAIIIGNHRDSFSVGATPASGSAVLLELARVFGILLRKGWKPRRSIILASWDASEYGNVGSTEWVEDHLHWLDKNAIAYLNVDHAVTGPHFSAQASPLLNRLIVDVTTMVIDPKTSKSVYESWLDRFISEALERNDENEEYIDPLVQPIGTTPGLDSLAFFEHAGISSLSMSFDSDKYRLSHSAFDSISWMEEIGDPTFEYHQTMVKIWGLLALRLSSDTILPMYPIDYALAMKHHLGKLTFEKPTDNNKKKNIEIIKKHHHQNNNNSTTTEEHEFLELKYALKSFYKSTIKFNTKVQNLDHAVSELKTKKSKKKVAKQVNKANERLVKLERTFLQKKGLLIDRPWYKHAIFAPSVKTGLMQVFPSIVESREINNSKQIEDAADTIAYILLNAKGVLLRGEPKGHHHRLIDEEEVIF